MINSKPTMIVYDDDRLDAMRKEAVSVSFNDEEEKESDLKLFNRELGSVASVGSDYKVMNGMTLGMASNPSIQSMDVDDIRNSRLRASNAVPKKNPGMSLLTTSILEEMDESHVEMESAEVDLMNDDDDDGASSSTLSSSSFGSRANHIYGKTEMPKGLMVPQMTTQGNSIDDIHDVPMPPLPPLPAKPSDSENELEEKPSNANENPNPYHHEFEQLSQEIVAVQEDGKKYGVHIDNLDDEIGNEDGDNAPMSPKELDDAFNALKDNISEIVDE